MSSPRSWLFYAYREWICTVQDRCNILVRLSAVPHLEGYSQDGETVVLNVSHSAVRNFNYQEDTIIFDTTFSGRSVSMSLNYSDVLGFVSPDVPQFEKGGLILIDLIPFNNGHGLAIAPFVESTPRSVPVAANAEPKETEADTTPKNNVSRPNFLRVVK